MQGSYQQRLAAGAVPRHSERVLATVREILAKEGALALYKGLLPGLVKTIPASAVTFFVYESTAAFFRDRHI